jgi:hypothetical protein
MKAYLIRFLYTGWHTGAPAAAMKVGANAPYLDFDI